MTFPIPGFTLVVNNLLCNIYNIFCSESERIFSHHFNVKAGPSVCMKLKLKQVFSEREGRWPY